MRVYKHKCQVQAPVSPHPTSSPSSCPSSSTHNKGMNLKKKQLALCIGRYNSRENGHRHAKRSKALHTAIARVEQPISCQGLPRCQNINAKNIIAKTLETRNLRLQPPAPVSHEYIVRVYVVKISTKEASQRQTPKKKQKKHRRQRQMSLRQVLLLYHSVTSYKQLLYTNC